MKILSCVATSPELPPDAIERGLDAQFAEAADSGNDYRELMLQGLAEAVTAASVPRSSYICT